ncbi:MAG: V4R domain-containing protein [Conexivisphaera sp.]
MSAGLRDEDSRDHGHGSGSGSRSRSRGFRLSLQRFDPGRDLVAVKVETDSSAKMGMFFDYVDKRGLTMLGATVNRDPEGVVAFTVLDATEMGRDTALEVLRSVPLEDLRVEVVDSGVRGFASTGGHLLDAGSGRSVIASERTLRGFFRGMRELMGDDAGAAFLYYAGFVSGREWGKFLVDLGYDPGAAVKINFETLESQGYATSITVLEGEDVYRIEAHDLVECDLLSGYAAGKGGHVRTSHWFRGAVAGFLTAVRGGEWSVEEVECVNDGSDKCAFEARRKK